MYTNYVFVNILQIVCIAYGRAGNECFVGQDDRVMFDINAKWFTYDSFKRLLIKPKHAYIGDIVSVAYRWVEEEQRKKWFANVNFRHQYHMEFLHSTRRCSPLHLLHEPLLVADIDLLSLTLWEKSYNFTFDKIFKSEKVCDSTNDILVNTNIDIGLLQKQCMKSSRCIYPNQFLSHKNAKICQFDGACDMDSNDGSEDGSDDISLGNIETDLNISALDANMQDDANLNNINNDLSMSAILHGNVNTNIDFVESGVNEVEQGVDEVEQGVDEIKEVDFHGDGNGGTIIDDATDGGDIDTFVYDEDETGEMLTENGWMNGVNVQVSTK